MAEDQSIKGGRRRWLWPTIGLSVLAALAGSGLAGNYCYWQGRAAAEHLPYRLLAYAPANAPLYWLELAIAAVWLVFWLNFVRSQKARGYPWPAVMAPAFVLVFFTWQQLSAAHACSF